MRSGAERQQCSASMPCVLSGILRLLKVREVSILILVCAVWPVLKACGHASVAFALSLFLSCYRKLINGVIAAPMLPCSHFLMSYHGRERPTWQVCVCVPAPLVLIRGCSRDRCLPAVPQLLGRVVLFFVAASFAGPLLYFALCSGLGDWTGVCVRKGRDSTSLAVNLRPGPRKLHPYSIMVCLHHAECIYY